MSVSGDAVDQASKRYDLAEQAYIAAVAAGAQDQALRRLARDVVEAAQTWESADSAAGAPPDGVTRYYDAPELLLSLWRDLADAHDRRAL